MMRRTSLAGALIAGGLIVPAVALRAEDPKPRPPRDAEVVRTTHGHHNAAQAVPSAQAVQQAPPPVAMIPQPPQLVTLQQQAVPVVQMPAPQPLVLQTQSPSIVLQQSPPTVYLAQPSQPATVQVLAPAPMAPNYSLMQQPTASPQLFLAPAGTGPSAQGVTAPQPQMMMAAPAPAQPQVMMMMAAAPQPTVAAAAPVATTQLEAIPPGPLGRAIGGFGEMLAKHKLPRIRATTSTVINQAQVTLAPTQPTVATPVVAEPLEPNVAQPSPQGGHLFRHPFKLHGR